MPSHFDEIVVSRLTEKILATSAAALTVNFSSALGSTAALTIFLTGAAAAVTLAAPKAGDDSVGGDDGKILSFVSTGAVGHVITTPAGKINSNKVTATFGAVIGNNIVLQAYNGYWWVISQVGITLA